MPIYQLRCDCCDYEYEEILRVDERNDQVCQECFEPMRVVITPHVGFVGAIFDKKIDTFHKQIGRTFESNAEYRQYLKENPGWVPVSKDDKVMRDRRDFHKNGMDRTARALGYNDHEHKVRVSKAERRRKNELK